MKRAFAGLVLVCALGMGVGCSSRGAVTVPQEAGLYQADWERAELYFGMARADGADVSDLEFKKFLDTVVTPVFPDGLTLVPTYGQYRGKDGKLTREDGRLIIVILPADPANQVKLDSVREAYKKQFKQESVLLCRQPAIVSF